MAAIAPAASLRPRGMGQLLDQAIRLYRANFLKFIGIIALVEIPVGILQVLSSSLMLRGITGLSSSMETDPNTFLTSGVMGQYLGGMGANGIVSVLSYFLVQGIGIAALTRAIADGYMGEPVEILGSYRKIGKYWGSLIGALLLMSLVILGTSVWMIVPCVGWLTGPGMLVFMSIVMLPMLGPIIVLEKAPAMTAIRRAWDLGRARFWWLIGYVGILMVFNFLVISGPIALLSLVLNPLRSQSLLANDAAQTLVMTTVIQQGLAILLSVLYVSLQSVAITLAYFDLRMRLEGFDLAIQALSPDQSLVEQMSQAPQSQASGKIITKEDFLHFLSLSLVFVALYAVIAGVFFIIALGAAGLGAPH